MRLARPLLILLAAALAAMAFAAPASAAHPERPPQAYSAWHLGPGPCDWYETFGEVSFPAVHPPEPNRAHFIGDNVEAVAEAPPGEDCPPTAPGDRVIEFTAYTDGGEVVASHGMTMEFGEGYEVELASEQWIEYVTIAVCLAEPSDVIDRCGEADTVHSSGPTAPSCVFEYSIVNDWGSGWQGRVLLSPLVDPGEDWLVVITLPEGTVIQQGWKAQIKWVDDKVRFTPPAWAPPIPVGGWDGPGFIGTGPIPPESNVEAYVNGRECVTA